MYQLSNHGSRDEYLDVKSIKVIFYATHSLLREFSEFITWLPSRSVSSYSIVQLIRYPTILERPTIFSRYIASRTLGLVRSSGQVSLYKQSDFHPCLKDESQKAQIKRDQQRSLLYPKTLLRFLRAVSMFYASYLLSLNQDPKASLPVTVTGCTPATR